MTMFQGALIFAAIFIPLIYGGFAWAEFDKNRNPRAWK